jgi:hypothetical protein
MNTYPNPLDSISDDFRIELPLGKPPSSKESMIQNLVSEATRFGFQVQQSPNPNFIKGILGDILLEISIDNKNVTTSIYQKPDRGTVLLGKNCVCSDWAQAEQELNTLMNSFFQSRPISALTFKNQQVIYRGTVTTKPLAPVDGVDYDNISYTRAELVTSLERMALKFSFEVQADLFLNSIQGSLDNTLLKIQLTDTKVTICLWEKKTVYCYPPGKTFVVTNYKDAAEDLGKVISSYLQIKSSIHPSRIAYSGGRVTGPE